MIGLIILGLAFLFFLVVAFFAAKTWHVGHVVSLSFLFLFTLLTLFMTATLFRTNQEYHPKYLKASEDLARQVEQTQLLKFGKPSDPQGLGSVTGERTLAKVEQASRGRVWRNVYAMPGGQGGALALNMRGWNNDGCLRVGKEEDEFSDDEIEPVADEEVDAADEEVDAAAEDAAPAGDAESSHGIMTGQYVYAFKEFPIAKMTTEQKAYFFGSLESDGDESFPNTDKKGLCRVPIAYLGKFFVADANDNALQVQLQGVPDQGQIAQLNNKAPWVLYERLPTDVADLFGESNADAVAKLLPLQWFVDFGVPIGQSAYSSMIAEYGRDGDIAKGRVNNPFRLKVEVKFLQDYEQIVDLQVEGELPPADRPFNVEGHAQVKSMIQGAPTSFKKDDTAFFDGATAESLVQQRIAERVGDPIYSRQLRSFEYSIGDYQMRFDTVRAEIQLVKGRVDELTASLNNLQSQIDKHREELDQLQQDQQGFDAEKVELEKYKKQLEMRYKSLQGEIGTLTGSGFDGAGMAAVTR